MILHTFNKALNSRSLLTELLQVLGHNDAILFFEDGVYWGEIGSPFNDLLLQTEHSPRLFCLDDDLSARGIQAIDQKFQRASYAKFVELSASFNKVTAWY